MKKTLLLTSLVASMVAMAGTTGSVEGYNENEATFVKGAKPTFIAKKTGVKTEVKVNGTGFSFGGDFKAEDLELGKVTKANYLNHSSVWAKYELPEIKGVKTYVKATVSPKFDTTPEYEYVPKEDDLKAEYNTLLGTESDKEKVNKKLVEVAKGYKLDDTAIATIKASDTKENQVTALAKARIGALKAKNAVAKREDKGNAELEGQVSYKYDVLTFGFNSKTNFPLSNKQYSYELADYDASNHGSRTIKDVKDYGATVKSTHKVFVESEEGKDVFVKGLKDVKANVEIKHNYAKTVTKAGERVDYVSGHLGATYDGVKDLRLEGAFDFKVNVNKAVKLDDGDFKDTIGAYNYSDTYDFKAIYTGVKGLKLTVNPFLGHYNLAKAPARSDILTYGANLEAEYKMLNDKLTLTGKSKLQGASLLVSNVPAVNYGKFDFDVNAKYKYDVNEKFNVTPEATAHLGLNTLQGVLSGVELVLTPKVSAEYKPTDTLTLKGSVEAPVKFKTVGTEFKYTDTQVKTSLNLKYEWK
ncbi:hypothetical protein ACF3OF_06840 [Sneathia vaginalis]|uniref:hypothetical protein n=1 Tax=Sneathia vaginalis TaxID=187101 RepID=UPI00370D98B9